MTPDLPAECAHDWQQYWDGSLGYTATDYCARCHAYRPTPATPDLPIPEEALEAAAKAMYHFVEGEHAPWLRSGVTVYYRDEARAALAAALPHLRSLQVETQVRAGYAIGRKDATDEISDAIQREADLLDSLPKDEPAVNRQARSAVISRASAFRDSVKIAREVGSQPQNATSEPRTGLPASPSHPKDSRAAREAL